MKISVSGKQMDVGASLKEYVEENIESRVSKYFDRAIDADITFHKESHLFCADIVVNEGTGKNLVIRGQASEGDVYAAFDKAAERIEKQLRRYKRRLKNHRHQEPMLLAAEGTKTVFSSSEDESQENDAPIIINEKQTAIETLSVSDAVMRMDLANLPALMFINEKTGDLDVVYYRKDGNISWIASKCNVANVKKKEVA